MQNMPSRPQSLQDYLDEQIPFLDLSPDQHEAIEYLISNLDDRGYLDIKKTPFADLAAGFGKPITEDQLEDTTQFASETRSARCGSARFEGMFAVASHSGYAVPRCSSAHYSRPSRRCCVQSNSGYSEANEVRCRRDQGGDRGFASSRSEAGLAVYFREYALCGSGCDRRAERSRRVRCSSHRRLDSQHQAQSAWTWNCSGTRIPTK